MCICVFMLFIHRLKDLMQQKILGIDNRDNKFEQDTQQHKTFFFCNSTAFTHVTAFLGMFTHGMIIVSHFVRLWANF